MASGARGGGRLDMSAKLTEKMIAVLFILSFVIIAVNIPIILAAMKTLSQTEVFVVFVVEAVILVVIILTARQMVSITGHFLD